VSAPRRPAAGPAQRRRERLRHEREPNYPLIGIVSLVVLALLTWAVFVKRLPFGHRYEIHGVFASANQLRDGSPVRIAGVDVGTVTGIGRGPGDAAEVTMAIANQGRPVHSDARMQILPRLFLEGGYYVQLQPGTPAAPELADGATVPLAHTAIPVQVDQILSVLDRPTRGSLKSLLGQLSHALSGGGGAALRTAFPALPATLRDGAIALQALQGTHVHDPSGLISGSSRVTAALAAQDAHLADLISSLDRTSTALADRDSALAATVSGLDSTLRASPAALAALDSALPRLRDFTAAVRPALPPAPAVLRSARAVFAQVGALVRPGELPRLQDQLDPALGDLPTLETRLGGLLPLVTPVVSCVRDRAVPVLLSKLDDGALSSGRPAWQDLAHTMVGLASAGQSFDGDGSWVRFLAVSGASAVSTGSLPGEGSLFGSDSSSVIGSRPLWLGQGQTPPFRPDQPCTGQPPPDLTARTGPAMAAAGSGARRAQPRPADLARLRAGAAAAARRASGSRAAGRRAR
jgi:virulence factor Mce-like protein